MEYLPITHYACNYCQKLHSYNEVCPFLKLYPVPDSSNFFNYECPDCHGKFKEPSYHYKEGNCFSIKNCPFCNREMKGL